MHPALSVIFFTTASGAGYGLLFWLALVCAIDPAAVSWAVASIGLGLGLLFCSAGLLSSMLHLGRPERAWRAFSQWRSSWLSREGVIASFTYLPALALGLLCWRGETGWALRGCALLLALCCALTVFCTARIYSSLKTIAAWHHPLVVPVYLLLALASGAVWALLVAVGFNQVPEVFFAVPGTILLLAASLVLKLAYWRDIDRRPASSSPESATGLGRFGKVTSFERPHTEQNYLLHEMGYVLARKHARRLRSLTLLLLVVAVLLLLPLLPWPAMPLRSLPVALAALSTLLAILLERWLFFAEAKHLVMLYYQGRNS